MNHPALRRRHLLAEWTLGTVGPGVFVLLLGVMAKVQFEGLICFPRAAGHCVKILALSPRQEFLISRLLLPKASPWR